MRNLAALLYCKSLIYFTERPEMIDPIADDFAVIRIGNESDFTLLKYLVKTLIGQFTDLELQHVFELEPLKERLERVKRLE